MDCRTRKGVTPFWIACKEGHIEIAQVLAKHGADVEVIQSTLYYKCLGCYSLRSNVVIEILK